MTDRAPRHQLTVSLGVGERGRKRKKRLVKAAKQAGAQNLSEWVLDVLLSAAGEPRETATRTTLSALEKRVEWLEAALSEPRRR